MPDIVPSVFVHIPKTAGRAVLRVVRQYPDQITLIGHSRPKASHHQLFSFGFTRHPATRLRSAFYHLIDVPPDAPDTKYIRFRLHLLETYGHDFERFILAKGFAEYQFPHLKPMTWWSPLSFDFLGRFETIDKDWKRLCETIRLPYEPLTHDPAHATDYSKASPVTPQMIRVIREHYAQDFVRFRYGDTP